MKIKLDKILCATDFSDFSRYVIHFGVGLALRFNSHLTVFHAISFPRDQLYGNVLSRGGERKKLADKACGKIRNLMENHSHELKWEPLASFGDPVDEAAQIAEQQNADIVIAASYGLSGLKRILLGTVVERMARTVSRPLLVVHPPKHPETDIPLEFRKIVAGCALSDDSSQSLKYAISLAVEFQAELHLLHAVETPLDEDIVNPAQAPYGEVQQKLQDRLCQRLARLVPDEVFGQCNVKTVLIKGVPGEGLSSYAAENGADLIVIGVRHRSAIEKLLVGSTTEAVLRHAPCPVLVIPLKLET
ncbi:MAG: universal stress protein [Desulfobacterales bacterium]|nr:universal stress protein [Desulfobacterales bacterium]